MFTATLKTIGEHFSGVVAKAHVAEISQHHRIQASPGYRAAAEYVAETLKAAGVKVAVHHVPGDGKTTYWNYLMPGEWWCHGAELSVIEPKEAAGKLCDYRESKLAVIQRTFPTPAGGIEAEVVLLEDGAEEKEYEGLDLKGKIVLTKAELARVRQLAVEERGAIGILYDGMAELPGVRGRSDLPDDRQYTSFWWTPEMAERGPCFGFVLTPRQGDRLRATIKKRQADGKGPVRVKAWVDAGFTEAGQIELVDAWIAGSKRDEEVLLIAHLCHPQPSANDNASGAATLLELATTLHKRIASGDLPRPPRTIRFLWVPEMSGTYAYLATRPDRVKRTIAAINLDMVGENQELCHSAMLVEMPPAAASSFVGPLAAAIQATLTVESPDSAKSHSGQGGYALFRHAVTPFSGGSDHYVLSDPTVGIPCPMIICWPDKFYHTSADTLDKVDPKSCWRAGVLAGTYAHFLAGAGDTEAAWLGHEMMRRFRVDVIDYCQSRFTATMEKVCHGKGKQEGETPDPGRVIGTAMVALERQIAYRIDRQVQALETLHRLGSGKLAGMIKSWQSEAALFAQGEMARTRNALQGFAASQGWTLPTPAEQSLTPEEETASQKVPRRVAPGPIPFTFLLSNWSKADREAWRQASQAHKEFDQVAQTVAVYWADGKRTLLAIADLVEMETGKRDVPFLLTYFDLLAKAGAITW